MVARIKVLVLIIMLFCLKEACAQMEESDKQLQVKAGEQFTITLESNRTTGYSWHLAEPLDETIVTLIGSEYVRPDKVKPGAGGREIWTFKAVEEGKTVINFKYIRSWEKDKPPARKCSYTITIGDDSSGGSEIDINR